MEKRKLPEKERQARKELHSQVTFELKPWGHGGEVVIQATLKPSRKVIGTVSKRPGTLEAGTKTAEFGSPAMISVNEGFQRKGVGARLYAAMMRAAIAAADKSGAAKVVFKAVAEEPPGRRLMRRLGFRRGGEDEWSYYREFQLPLEKTPSAIGKKERRAHRRKVFRERPQEKRMAESFRRRMKAR